MSEKIIEIVCPECGGKARRTETRWGTKNTCCHLWSWGDGEPLVSEETHAARRRAHVAFDPLWQSGRMTRADAYRELAHELGLSVSETHIKKMDEATARLVPTAALRIENQTCQRKK